MIMTTKKKVSIPKSPPPYDSDYDAFVQGLELIGLALKSCRCDIDREAFYAVENKDRTFIHKYRLTDLSDGSFDAEGDFELSISESPEAAPILKMECEFQVHMHAKPGLSEEHAERFISNELRLILVPHARQLFFSLTAQMSIPPVITPLTTRSERAVKKNRREPRVTQEVAAADEGQGSGA
jgi:hypothetical protein